MAAGYISYDSKTYTICIVSTKSTRPEESSVRLLIDHWNAELTEEQGISLSIVPSEDCTANIYIFLVSDHIDESKLETVINNPDPIVIFYRTSGSTQRHELNTVINKFHGRCAFVDHSSSNDFTTKLLDLLRHTANR